MKTVSQEKIEDLIENGYAMNVTDYISGGIQMVKDNLGMFVGYTLLMFVISSVAGMMPFGSIAVGAPLSAGFFIAANRLNQGYEIELGDFFKGFEYFGQLVVYSLLMLLAFAALAIPAGVFIGSMFILDFDSEVAILFSLVFGFASAIAITYFAVSFMWAPHLIVFGNKKAFESLDLSRRIIRNDFWNFIGMGILLGLMNIAGAMFFGIGLLFTIPASACALYLAFEDVTEMSLDGDDQYIDRHLVD